MARYWVYDAEKHRALGPFTVEQLKKVPDFGPETLIAPENAASAGQWLPAKTFEEMRPLFMKAPPLPGSRPKPPVLKTPVHPQSGKTAGIVKPGPDTIPAANRTLFPSRLQKVGLAAVVAAPMIAVGMRLWIGENDVGRQSLPGAPNKQQVARPQTSPIAKEPSRSSQASPSSRRKNRRRKISGGAENKEPKRGGRKQQEAKQSFHHQTHQVVGPDTFQEMVDLTRTLSYHFPENLFKFTSAGLGGAATDGGILLGHPVEGYRALLGPPVDIMNHFAFDFNATTGRVVKWMPTAQGVDFLMLWPTPLRRRQAHVGDAYVRSRVRLPRRRYYWPVVLFSNEVKESKNSYGETQRHLVVDLVAVFAFNRPLPASKGMAGEDEWVMVYDDTMIQDITAHSQTPVKVQRATQENICKVLRLTGDSTCPELQRIMQVGTFAGVPSEVRQAWQQYRCSEWLECKEKAESSAEKDGVHNSKRKGGDPPQAGGKTAVEMSADELEQYLRRESKE